MIFRMVINVEPVAQGRPRASSIGGFTRLYDPKVSRDWKALLKSRAERVQGSKPPYDGAMNLALRVYRQIPRGFSKKRADLAEAGLIYPTTKPDLSNYVKGVEDALNKIVYRDDSAIVTYNGTGKWYSVRPRIEIELTAV